MPIEVGDHILLRMRGMNWPLEPDLMEKIGRVTDVDEYEVVLAFPRGIVMKGQTWQSVNLPHPKKRSGYGMQVVRCSEHIATMDELYAANKEQMEYMMNHTTKKSAGMLDDIKARGIRHLPVVSGDMKIAYGFTRVHCAKALGWKSIEVYRCFCNLDELFNGNRFGGGDPS